MIASELEPADHHDAVTAPLRMMRLIRAFETALAARPDHGFQLLSAGEEAVAVGLCAALGQQDQLLTGGRSIGPALARGLDPGHLMAELLGKVGGLNKGRAGRGHVAAPDHGFFGAHAVVGGNISIAAGVALSRQLSGSDGVVACLFGDGACGNGVLHETLNIAAIWRLPVLFVCNNNQLSVSTRRDDALAPRRLSDIASAFAIPASTIDGMAVQTVSATVSAATAAIRAGGGPVFVECLSHRFGRHSTNARETRTRAELQALQAACPIAFEERRLIDAGRLSSAALQVIDSEIRQIIIDALAYADSCPLPDPSDVLVDVL